mgnify:FL=1
MERPNLFSFATSELSQDAFICWLVSWANNPEEKELSGCAKDFICVLYNLNKSNKISPEAVTEVKNIRKQYFKTDVYFQVVLNNGIIISFIIEDKVHTFQHSNQLQRYKEKIENDEIKEDEIVLIYYKTGYIFDWDKQVVNYGYSILKSENIIDFLGKYQITNPIFTDYVEYIKTRFSYKPIIDELFSAKEGFKHFSNDYAQVEFINKLMEDSLDNINCYSMSNGTSFGKPWALYKFINIENIVYDRNEELFYKIVIKSINNSDAYFLSLRHYCKYAFSTNVEAAKNDKAKRLDFYINIFNSIKAEEITNLKFGKIRSDLSGNYESEIATIPFDSEKNTVQNVLTELPKFHKVFVNAVRKAMNL